MQYYEYSLLNDDLSAAKSIFSAEYWIQRSKHPILCWILISLLNIEFSAGLEANNDLCSLVGWHTNITDIFDKILICFRLRWEDPGSIQEGTGGSQDHFFCCCWQCIFPQICCQTRGSYLALRIAFMHHLSAPYLDLTPYTLYLRPYTLCLSCTLDLWP